MAVIFSHPMHITTVFEKYVAEVLLDQKPVKLTSLILQVKETMNT